MKTHGTRPTAQGELYIRQVATLPPGLIPVEAKDGRVVVGHSETGHHHVMDARTTTMYRLPEEIYELFLVVTEPTQLVHLRSVDTHEPIFYPPGNYIVRRQREYTPEGWRRAAD
jgi:hypothetical protein